MVDRSKGYWHEWFAWHPVVTDFEEPRWLVTVARRYNWADARWQYRSL